MAFVRPEDMEGPARVSSHPARHHEWLRADLALAYSLVFALPGSPVLRYGDEIGMGDDLSLKEREAVRTPMRWSDEPQAGFSLADKTVHPDPVVSEGIYNHTEVNVEAQRRDPNSLLNWTAHMIRLRKECPEVGWGEVTVSETGSDEVLAMCHEWRGNALVTVHNLGDKPHDNPRRSAGLRERDAGQPA